MNARISCITLAVDDIEKSLTFYHDGLGLTTQSNADLAGGADHVALELPGDLYLVLILRAGFAEFTKMTDQIDAPRGSSECILSYFAASKEEVDAILERAATAGGTVPRPAKDEQWGYAGYIKDPDGHLWEIMWNPKLIEKD
jgi:predicted lactoylglutathione lyase